MFVSSTSGIIFNLSASAVTDHSRSVKDIAYFKSLLYAKDPGLLKPVLILLNRLNKPGEQARNRN